MSAKAESITDGNIDIPDLRLVEGQVQVWVDFLIISKMINGRRDYTVFDGHDGCHRLYGSCSPEQMPGHGLGGTDVELVGFFTEYRLDCFQFCYIAQRR